MMKINMMSCMMDTFPVEEIIATAVVCQMDGIDWVDLHGRSARELKRLCDRAGLPVAAHTGCKEGFIHRRSNAGDELQEMIEDAVTLNAPILMIPPFPRDGQKSPSEERKEYAEYYAGALPLAQAAGLTLTLESTGYWNSSIVTADECLEVLQQVPGLRLTFDPGNVATAEEPVSAYQKLKDYVVYLHWKDWKFSATPLPGYAPVRNGRYAKDVLLGQGDLDLHALWDQMEPRHRALPVNLETRDFDGQNPPLALYQKIISEMKRW